jgi:hypothetical protein
MNRHGPRIDNRRQWGIAWITLSLAFGAHVLDEALHDFLSFWNPLVLSLREKAPYLPMPTFTFGVWIGGLILAVLILLFLSRFAFRGSAWMRPLSYLLSIIMLGNGLLHIGASLYLGRAAPGVYSSPLLLAASAYLFVSIRRHWKQHTGDKSGAPNTTGSD